jgi:hypothetical protein
MTDEELRLLKDKIIIDLLRNETQQQRIKKPEVFKQREAGVILGLNGIGYEMPLGSGMLKGVLKPNNLSVLWNNKNNNVDMKLKHNGDAYINWNGNF